MKHFRKIKLFGCTFCKLMLLFFFSACVHKQRDELKTSQSRPNVLVIFSDQWRASSFGYQGNPNVITPNKDYSIEVLQSEDVL